MVLGYGVVCTMDGVCVLNGVYMHVSMVYLLWCVCVLLWYACVLVSYVCLLAWCVYVIWYVWGNLG